VSKVLRKYVFVDLSGTYNQPIGPPIRRKTKPLTDARMLAVILQQSESKRVYYLKFAGKSKTVSANAKAFRKSFGGNAQTEKEIKLPGRSKP